MIIWCQCTAYATIFIFYTFAVWALRLPRGVIWWVPALQNLVWKKKIAATSNFFLQLEHIQRYNRVKNLAQKVPGFKNTGSAVGAKLVRKKN